MKKILLSMVASVLTALPLLGAPGPGLPASAPAAKTSVPAAKTAASRWKVYAYYADAKKARTVALSLLSMGYDVRLRVDGKYTIVYIWQ